MNKETFIDGNKTVLNTNYYLHLLSCKNENTNLKQALIDIREYVKKKFIFC